MKIKKMFNVRVTINYASGGVNVYSFNRKGIEEMQVIFADEIQSAVMWHEGMAGSTEIQITRDGKPYKTITIKMEDFI